MGSNYYYDYFADVPDAEMNAFFAVFAVFAGFYLLMLAFSVVCYVLGGMGLYTAAKRWGIAAPGLAWIPIGSIWITGALGDECHRRATGKRSGMRFWMVAMYVIGLFFYIMGFACVFGSAIPYIHLEELPVDVVPAMLGGMMLILIGMLPILAACVLHYIEVYRYFEAASPENAVLYIILTILLGIVYPFFLFYLRKRGRVLPEPVSVHSVYDAGVEP